MNIRYDGNGAREDDAQVRSLIEVPELDEGAMPPARKPPANWIEQERARIPAWLEEQIGIRPSVVRQVRAWLGEDEEFGVAVFRASMDLEDVSARIGVSDWWVVSEPSGRRAMYPCMISTAGDMARYHHQVRSAKAPRPGPVRPLE